MVYERVSIFNIIQQILSILKHVLYNMKRILNNILCIVCIVIYGKNKRTYIRTYIHTYIHQLKENEIEKHF